MALTLFLAGLAAAGLACAFREPLPAQPTWSQVFLPFAVGGSGTGVPSAVATRPPAALPTLAPPDRWQDPGDYAGCSVKVNAREGTDERVDRVELRRYNEFGALYEKVVDRHADGTVDASQRWLFDDGGWPHLVVDDLDGDRRADQIETLSYRDDRLVSDVYFEFRSMQWIVTYRDELRYDGRYLVEELDSSDSSPVASRKVESFYEAGRRVRLTRDYQCDGSIDHIEHDTWRGDRLVRRAFDTDGDGATDLAIEYGYDEKGLVTEVRNEDRETGRTFLAATLEYDGNGWLRCRTDYARDGAVDRVNRYDYDTKGRLLSHRLEQGGYPPFSEQFENDCP